MIDDLPPIDYLGRLDQLRTVCDVQALDAMLLVEPVNISWLCGFGGSTARLVVTADGARLIVDGRYAERAAADIADAGVSVEVVVATTGADVRDHTVSALSGLGAVGCEGNRMTYRQYQALAADVSLTATNGLIESLRRIKQPGEVERMARAAAIADVALLAILPQLEGMHERDVQIELDYRMQRDGSEGVSFDTIVASGETHAARPHHATGQRRIEVGDTVIIDLGAVVGGYHSDMTRSFVVGTPTAEQRRRYEALRQAQQAALDAVGPGVAAAEIDTVGREVLAAYDLDGLFIHGTGHGVGLEIHEEPFIGPTSTATLEVGDVVTIEPGVYEPGFGGFRIEDLVEVTPTGPRVLTTAPKGLEWIR